MTRCDRAWNVPHKACPIKGAVLLGTIISEPAPNQRPHSQAFSPGEKDRPAMRGRRCRHPFPPEGIPFSHLATKSPVTEDLPSGL